MNLSSARDGRNSSAATATRAHAPTGGDSASRRSSISPPAPHEKAAPQAPQRAAGATQREGRARPGSGGSLDTLAQLDNSEPSPSSISTGQTAEQLLHKRARAKYLSTPLGAALADLRRSQRVAAEVAGDLESAEQHRRLEKSYRNTVYCAGKLVQSGEKLEGRYCSNRWCLVCARVKTGRAINRYAATLASWPDRWLVTLTAPNVSADELEAELRRYLAVAVAISRSMKGVHRVPLVAVRKLECTYNEKADSYHPHFHFVVRDEAAARLLLKLWLERQPSASAKAQDVRRASEGDVRELFKYFTKLVTRAASNPRARGSVRVVQARKLDVIFAAMRGLRVFQPIGFQLPKASDEELPIGSEGHTRAPEHTRDRAGDFPATAFWNWEQLAHDWINGDGEPLSNYDPSEGMRDLVAGIESQKGAG